MTFPSLTNEALDEIDAATVTMHTIENCTGSESRTFKKRQRGTVRHCEAEYSVTMAMNALTAAKPIRLFLPSITLTTMAQKGEGMANLKGLPSTVGSRIQGIRMTFNCSAEIAIGANMSRTCNDYPKGVGPSGPKRPAPARGEDIVCSAWKHAAVHKRTGKVVAHLAEHKGFMYQLAGYSSIADTRYTGNQAAVAPTSSHQIIAADVSAEADLTATSSETFDLSLIDKAVLKARTLSPIVRPCNAGKAGKKFVMFITPEQHYDLRRNTNTLQWGDIQKAAIQGGQISGNPIFDGSLGEYNGVVLHEAFRLPVFDSTGGSGVGRAVLCGAQAAAFAFGRGYSTGNRMSWTEELFDYKNQLGVEAGTIAGLKKTVYNSKDYGTIVVSTAHSAAATANSGRD